VAKWLEPPRCYVEREEIPRKDITDRRRYFSREEFRLEFTPDGRLLKLSCPQNYQQAQIWNNEHFGKRGSSKVRGKCRGFPKGCRSRLMDKLNTVSKAAPLPEFFTATLPDQCYEENLEEFAIKAKGYEDAFSKRLNRVAPEAAFFWRTEWKARKWGLYPGKLFPHFHGLLFNLPRRPAASRFDSPVERIKFDNQEGWLPESEAVIETFDTLQQWEIVSTLGSAPVKPNKPTLSTDHGGRRFVFSGNREDLGKCQCLLTTALMADLANDGMMSFREWATLAWYQVVGSGNPDHLLHGWDSTQARSWGHVMSYCSGYIAKPDAEGLDVPLGRHWGIHNRDRIPWAKKFEITLEPAMGNRLRRAMRKCLERRLSLSRCRRVRLNRPQGVTLYCDVVAWMRFWASARPPDPF